MDEYAAMPPIYVTYMNRFDVEALGITDDEILAAIEEQLGSQAGYPGWDAFPRSRT